MLRLTMSKTLIPPAAMLAAGVLLVLAPDAGAQESTRDFEREELRQAALSGLRGSDVAFDDEELDEEDAFEVSEVRRQEASVRSVTALPEPAPSDAAAAADVALDAEPEPEVAPYDPLGVRVGNLLVFPEVTLGIRHTDNVFESSSNSRSDHAYVLAPRVRVESNWSRHALDADVALLRTYFDEFSSEDEDEIEARVGGRLDISERTNIEAEAFYAKEQESRGDVNVPNAVAEPPDEETTAFALQGNHRFNRLTVSLRGDVAEEEFEDVPLVGGGTFVNSARDNTERELTGRLAYEFKPEVAAFVEASVNEIEFDRTSGGVTLDSTGYAVLGGVSLELGGKVTGEVAVGYANQDPDAASLQGVDGVIVDAALTWRASGLTTVTFNADYEVDTSTISNSIGSLVRTFGVSLEHAFRRNIIVTASAFYEVEEFAGSTLEEREFTGALEAEYRLNRFVALLAQYEHTDFDSTANNADYTENQVQLAMRLRR